MPRKRQEANHHALVGFRGMPRQGEAVIFVIVAIHVGNMEDRFTNRRVRGHAVPWGKRAESGDSAGRYFLAIFSSANVRSIMKRRSLATVAASIPGLISIQ